MNEGGLRNYLENEYLGSLGPRSIDDVVSRCRRIEKSLGVDLDEEHDPELLLPRVDEISQDRFVVRDLRTALYRYAEFRKAKSQ